MVTLALGSIKRRQHPFSRSPLFGEVLMGLYNVKRTAAITSQCFYLADQVHVIQYLAKDNVLAIEPARHDCSDEELS